MPAFFNFLIVVFLFLLLFILDVLKEGTFSPQYMQESSAVINLLYFKLFFSFFNRRKEKKITKSD